MQSAQHPFVPPPQSPLLLLAFLLITEVEEKQHRSGGGGCTHYNRVEGHGNSRNIMGRQLALRRKLSQCACKHNTGRRRQGRSRHFKSSPPSTPLCSQKHGGKKKGFANIQHEKALTATDAANNAAVFEPTQPGKHRTWGSFPSQISS